MRIETIYTLKQNPGVTISHVAGGDTFMVKIKEGESLVDWMPKRSLSAAKNYVSKQVNIDHSELLWSKDEVEVK